MCFATVPVGLKRGLSSESALLYKVIRDMFIDFRKASDSVDHNIVSYKLQACGISGSLWEWLLSFLTNRHQFVEIIGTKSDLGKDEYGVSQGSHVDPRLFSIYINDFSESVSQGELRLYANNTTAFVIGDSTDDVVRKLNLQFAEICRWCN